MELFISFIWLGLSLALLIWGANKFIDSASLIAGKFGISDFIIGLSIIALGTSFPEIFVGISAIVNNNEELYSHFIELVNEFLGKPQTVYIDGNKYTHLLWGYKFVPINYDI